MACTVRSRKGKGEGVGHDLMPKAARQLGHDARGLRRVENCEERVDGGGIARILEEPPCRPGDDLSKEKWAKLRNGTKKILEGATGV